MDQDTIWILLPIVLVYIINRMCKSHKYEVKPTQPPKIPATIYPKTTPIKPQEASFSWEKEDSLLDKNSSSRGKRMLSRSRLRQSILTSEILGKKY